MHAAAGLDASAEALPYASLFEHGPNPKIVVDDASLTIVAANDAALLAYGYAREEMLGLPIDAIWPSAAEVLGTGRAIALRPNLLTWIHKSKSGAPLDVMIGFQRVAIGARPATALHITEAGISTDITERKRAERELNASREELRALSQQLQHVREEERTRISREIHDELGQLLTGLNMNLNLLLRDVRAGALPAAPAAAQLESMQELVRRLIASVRRIATELRPEVLDALGIAAALEWQAEEFARRTGIGCEVRLAEASLQLDAQRSTALFRIFQEALSNVARHSGATRVIAQLRRNADSVVLIVADNGRGIAHDAGRDGPALGLLGMRERAAMLGGEAKTEGRPGHGTTVSVRLPL